MFIDLEIIHEEEPFKNITIIRHNLMITTLFQEITRISINNNHRENRYFRWFQNSNSPIGVLLIHE